MRLRATNVEKLGETTYDVLIVGGGINGAVSAACLSARGAKVALIDKGDFGGFTSQESSNLAWGGIKYLESFEFGLVRKLCVSRNRLIRAYPSTVQEMRFYSIHPRHFRHGRFKLYLGAWLYWLLGSGFTRRPRLLSKKQILREEAIVRLDGITGGFEYSDAYLHDNDARFVFNFVRSALNYGCVAANYVESLGSTREPSEQLWKTRIREEGGGREVTVRSRVLVNACGPYVDALNATSGQRTKHRHVFSKGVHLLVPQLTPHRRVLTLIADDGRMFFAIPMGPRTCIGTTDTRVDSPETAVTDEDRRFVLANINKRLRLSAPLTERDIVAERCGVRPLVVSGEGDVTDDWLQLSRKHVIESDPATGHVSIFGGKLTDCLNVGEQVASHVEDLGVGFPYPKQKWYGEPPDEVRDEFFHQAKLMDLDGYTAPTSSEPLSTRLWRRYGDEAIPLLERIRADRRMADLLIRKAEYIRCEIEQTARREMVVKLADFLRRRSKISQVISNAELRDAPGLHEAARIFFGSDAEARVEEYFASVAAAPPVRPQT